MQPLFQKKSKKFFALQIAVLIAKKRCFRNKNTSKQLVFFAFFDPFFRFFRSDPKKGNGKSP